MRRTIPGCSALLLAAHHVAAGEAGEDVCAGHRLAAHTGEGAAAALCAVFIHRQPPTPLPNGRRAVRGDTNAPQPTKAGPLPLLAAAAAALDLLHQPPREALAQARSRFPISRRFGFSVLTTSSMASTVRLFVSRSLAGLVALPRHLVAPIGGMVASRSPTLRE